MIDQKKSGAGSYGEVGLSSFLKPSQKVLERKLHVKVIVDLLKLPPVSIDIPVDYLTNLIFLAVKNVLQVVARAINLIYDMKEKFHVERVFFLFHLHHKVVVQELQ